MAKTYYIKQFVIKPTVEDEYGNDFDFCETGNQIVKVSIWTVPDVNFKINNGSTVMTNRTGMYEIDLTDLGVITSLKFATKNDYFKAKNSFCYIDILYTKEDEQ